MDYSEVFNLTIGNFKGEALISWFMDEKKITASGKKYAEITDSVSSYLEKQLVNIDKGSWIGLKSNNHYLWFAVFFGLLKIGYPVLLLDSAASDDQIKAFMQQSHMKAMVSDVPENHKGLLNISMSELENCEEDSPKNVCWESKIAFCTSGTTGMAKIYVFYADAIYAQCINVSYYLLNDKGIIKTRNEGGVSANPMLLALPLRHCLGFGVTLAFITAGYPIILPSKPGIFGMADTCRENGIWFLCSVPAIWKGLLRIAEARFGSSGPEAMKKLLGDKLTFGCCSGARLDPVTAKKLMATGIYIVNGWGMTETSFVTMGAIDDDPALDYVGFFYNKHEAVVIDPETGKMSSEGYGELAVKGRSMHSSVLHDGEEIFRDQNEYFRSGDLARLHNGRLYFKGRCKSVIISDSGENIYPEELDTHFSFLDNYTNQYSTVGYDDEPALFISCNDADDFERTPVFDKIINENLSLALGKRITRIFVTKKTMPITSKGETARFYLLKFLEDNQKIFRELSVKK